MKFANIADRIVTVELSPEDARRLAAACEIAADWMLGSCPEVPDLPEQGQARAIVADLYAAMAAAFEAAALAGAVDSYMLKNECTLENLRAGKVTDQLWPAA